MAIQQLQYDNKVAINIDSTIPDINKCNASDLNEIKSVVNGNSYETPKVSSQVDTDYINNMLSTKNLCNGIIQRIWLSSSGNECGIAPNSKGTYIKVSGGNYTISTTETQTRYRVACVDTLPTTNQSVVGYNGVGKDGTSDTITIDTTGHNYLIVDATNISKIQVEKGNTATTFEQFVPNTININNEKYTDTINVGTSINDKNRVNIIYSSNIFNNIFQQGGLDLGSTGGEQTSDIRIRSDYILVEPNTTYTISIGTNNLTHCGIGLYKSNRSYDSTHKINSGGWNTFPITFSTESDTQYIRVAFRYGDGNVITPNGDYKVQINKGYETTYEQYVNSSINVDNVDIYSKPVVLYDNPSGSNANINLLDNTKNYSYIKIFYGSGDSNFISSVDTLPGSYVLLSTIDMRNTISQSYIRSSLKQVSETTITNAVYSNVINYGTMKVTTSANEFRNENTIKIYRVLGFK